MSKFSISYEIYLEKKSVFDSLSQRISCPYCGEPIEILVDTSVDYQEYIEDCSVCCRPIMLLVTVSEDEVSVVARDENET